MYTIGKEQMIKANSGLEPTKEKWTEKKNNLMTHRDEHSITHNQKMDNANFMAYISIGHNLCEQTIRKWIMET